jgi:hypothetical protein
MSTIEKPNNASSIRTHWIELSKKTYTLCDMLDRTSGKLGRDEQVLINRIAVLMNTILTLKASPYYNPVQKLQTFDGTTVIAELAIKGALMMFKDIENTTGCRFNISPQSSDLASKPVANRSPSIVVKEDNAAPARVKGKGPSEETSVLIGIVGAVFVFFLFSAATVAFIDGTVGSVNITSDIILGFILLLLSVLAGIVTYKLIHNK